MATEPAAARLLYAGAIGYSREQERQKTSEHQEGNVASQCYAESLAIGRKSVTVAEEGEENTAYNRNSERSPDLEG